MILLLDKLCSPVACCSGLTAVLAAGLFICVKAYGSANLTFSLRAVPTMCPADFTAAGEQLLCSSLIGSGEQRHSGCSPEGTCQCLAPYAKPVRISSNAFLCIVR